MTCAIDIVLQSTIHENGLVSNRLCQGAHTRLRL